VSALADRLLSIESLAHDGRGVARVDGKAVFVAGALPGERVMARQVKRHRRFDEAVAVEVLEPAAGRVAPRCVHFGTCGGCALQHLDEAHQLELKRAHVEEQLARIGRVAPGEWLAPLGGAAWAYRRRARLGVKWVAKKGRVLVGFRERATPYIAEIGSCAVLAPPVGELIAPLAALVEGLSIRDRLPQIEVAVGENATALVLRVLGPPAAADLAALRAFAAAHGVEFYLQPGGYDTVAPLDPPGTPLWYTLPDFDVELRFQPTDFVQVNAGINRQAVSLAVRLLDPAPGDAVLDLFCGLGNFTLPLARRAARVVGVEGDAGLVGRARDNAARNGIANAAFHAADLAQDPGAAPWAVGPYQRVLLDPPRAGAAALLPMLGRLRPARMVYVSCHPASLARDAGELVHAHGFRLAAAGVMDMFPQTAHVESVAVFEAA
jgi:23S rRNA (uracil1939-C5)-methyltransferase